MVFHVAGLTSPLARMPLETVTRYYNHVPALEAPQPGVLLTTTQLTLPHLPDSACAFSPTCFLLLLLLQEVSQDFALQKPQDTHQARREDIVLICLLGAHRPQVGPQSLENSALHDI